MPLHVKIAIPTAILAVAWLFLVVSLGLPDWSKRSVGGGSITVGLFRNCVKGGGESRCSGNFERDCANDDDCTSMRSKMRGSAAMAFFAFFACTGAVIINGLNAIGIRSRDKVRLEMIGAVLSGAQAFFAFLAFAIWGAVNSDLDGFSLSSGWALTFLAFLMGAGCAVWLFLQYRKDQQGASPDAAKGPAVHQPPGAPPQQPAGAYPPQQPAGAYPPQQPGMGPPPPQQGYAPQQGYPPQQQGYVPQQAPPPGQGYPPQGGPPPPQY